MNKKKGLKELLERIMTEVDNILGVVAVAEDGVVLAEVGIENAEGIGAITVFIGTTGNYIGDTLGIGQTYTSTVDIKDQKILTFNMGDYQIGVLIDRKSSARYIISGVNKLLKMKDKKQE